MLIWEEDAIVIIKSIAMINKSDKKIRENNKSKSDKCKEPFHEISD